MPHTGSQLNVEGTPVMIVKFVHRSLLVTAVAGASLLASSSVAGAATPPGAAPGTGVPVAGGFIDSLTGIGTGTVYGAAGAIPYYVDYAPRGGRAMTLRRSPSGTILGLRHHPNRDRRKLRAQSPRSPPHRAYTIAVSALIGRAGGPVLLMMITVGTVPIQSAWPEPWRGDRAMRAYRRYSGVRNEKIVW